MPGLRHSLQRFALTLVLAVTALSSSGCKLLSYGVGNALDFSYFWLTTPLIPVSPYWSQQIEDTYWEEERYDRVPVLDPVEGENAPLFCLDYPSPDEVVRTLEDADPVGGGMPFIAEMSRNNIRIVVEPLVDSVGECRFYPLVGPARMHKCHFKCTVYFDKVIRSDWPIPYTFEDESSEVVYIDHDHLIRCAGPGTDGF
jgi:hypothetical protein